MMATDIVLESLGILAAEGIYSEADGVDEIVMVVYAVALVGDTAYIDRVRFALEEASEALLMIFGERPVASEVVAGAARHEADLDAGTLFGGDLGTHESVDSLGERTVATEDKYLVVASFGQFACKFDSVACVLGNAVCEGHMASA